MRAVALVLAGAVALSGARAGAAPPATARKIAVAPLAALGESDRKALAAMQATLATGLGAVPGVEIVADAALKKELKKSPRRAELEACEGETACLQALGALVGATHVVAGEVSTLSDGTVVYLKAVEVATGREVGSTTTVLPAAAAAQPNEARAAAYRLLAPDAYAGTLRLDIDVPGAIVFVDGRRVGRAPLAPVSLPVGQHALRVTHEAYRDFVRFVDVPFGTEAKLDVDLKAFPVVSDEMRQRAGKSPAPATPDDRAWWRSPWVVGGAAAGVAILTTIIAVAAFSGPDPDDEVTVRF